MIAMSLLVLRCQNIAETRSFYEMLGLSFQEEKHGNGPTHYSTVLDGGLVMELYPSSTSAVDNTRIGLYVPVLDDVITLLHKRGIAVGNRQTFGSSTFVVIQDPDGRKVELVERHSLQMAA